MARGRTLLGAATSYRLYSSRCVLRRQLYRSLSWVVLPVLQELTEEERVLRRLLRKTPTWSAGHASLAWNAIRQIEATPGKPDPRGLATLRISAQAVSELSVGSAELQVEVLALECVHASLTGQFEEVLRFYDRLEQQAGIMQLAERKRYRVWECAASAADLLGQRERAHAMLRRIPEAARSQAAKLGLRVLERAAQ